MPPCPTPLPSFLPSFSLPAFLSIILSVALSRSRLSTSQSNTYHNSAPWDPCSALKDTDFFSTFSFSQQQRSSNWGPGEEVPFWFKPSRSLQQPPDHTNSKVPPSPHSTKTSGHAGPQELPEHSRLCSRTSLSWRSPPHLPPKDPLHSDTTGVLMASFPLAEQGGGIVFTSICCSTFLPSWPIKVMALAMVTWRKTAYKILGRVGREKESPKWAIFWEQFLKVI